MCDLTGLYLNFLASQPSLAAQMSSLRSDDKVYSTSLKSEWTWRAGTCLWGWQGCVRCAEWPPGTHRHVCVRCLCPQHSLMPEGLRGWGWVSCCEANALRSSACVCPRVLQSVVLLSDSQLHLFLQSQLSVPEIEACVQGRSSGSGSDAILRYAMSNCGWAQEERRGSSHLAEGDQPKR